MTATKMMSAGTAAGMATRAPARAAATALAPALLFAGQALADAAPTPEKGDVAWMMTSTLLVLLMGLPGIALFYGGMVRSKNVLSILVQVFVVFSLLTVLWVAYGYSLAFSGSATLIGNFTHLFLAGITPASTVATFSRGVVIPEYIFIAFQCTFAALTACLVVGSFAERIRFSAVLIAMVIWFTFGYLPIARMVWYSEGFMFKLGALDFAGGTVVHINAGIAGLVGALMVGRRLGYGTTAMPPHNLPLVMVGASLLWVGWFGFNVGSNLEANSFAGLVFLNTFVATAAAVCAWTFVEWLTRRTPTMLGGASGAIAGLVAITPACGSVGPMGAIALGLIVAPICFWAITGLKERLGYDDSLDVFGVHCVGGIVGAVLTGVFASESLGGVGLADGRTMLTQVGVQALGVVITLAWSALVAAASYKIADLWVGLRVTEDHEREGLNTVSHGERAYT